MIGLFLLSEDPFMTFFFPCGPDRVGSAVGPGSGRKTNEYKIFGTPSKHKMFSTRRMRKKRRTERNGVGARVCVQVHLSTDFTAA